MPKSIIAVVMFYLTLAIVDIVQGEVNKGYAELGLALAVAAFGVLMAMLEELKRIRRYVEALAVDTTEPTEADK